jgi:hypothetical protein
MVQRWFHVIVTEDNGVPFPFQLVDLKGQIGFQTELKLGNDSGQPLGHPLECLLPVCSVLD